MKKLNNFHLQ